MSVLGEKCLFTPQTTYIYTLTYYYIRQSSCSEYEENFSRFNASADLISTNSANLQFAAVLTRESPTEKFRGARSRLRASALNEEAVAFFTLPPPLPEDATSTFWQHQSTPYVTVVCMTASIAVKYCHDAQTYWWSRAQP